MKDGPGLTGKFKRRLKMVGMSESMLAAEDRRRGGVRGVLEGFGLAGVVSSSLFSDFSGGVWFSELLGESVDILSRSLSDSSAIMAV